MFTLNVFLKENNHNISRCPYNFWIDFESYYFHGHLKYNKKCSLQKNFDKNAKFCNIILENKQTIVIYVEGT